MPTTPTITPEHAQSITRTTLGITSARDTAAPGAIFWTCMLTHCTASEAQ
jgi:hypothetical protein